MSDFRPRTSDFRARSLWPLLVAGAVVLTARAQVSPNLLLITLDTTRADRMGFMGSTRGLTPGLDAFARGAIVFERAYAQAPITTVSHATILSGTFPPTHRVSDFGAALAPDVPYLPALLKQRGYRTGAFVASLVLDPQNGTAPGFERGFDRYDGGFRVRRPGENRYQTIERRGGDVVDRSLQWIQTGGSAPWFAWVHLFDAHDPYDPPADLKTRFATALYDGEIAGVDRQVARLVQAASPHDVVVVTADHGEALGDHGEDTHGVFLYDAVMHVPLVVRLPDGKRAGTRVASRVRLADIAPMLLDAAGVPKPATIQGESLLTASGDGRPVYAETDYPRQAFGWSTLASWRNDRYLLIKAPTPELYDLVADPAAARNIAATRTRIADSLSAELAAFLSSDTKRSSQPSAPDPSVRRPDPAVAERLASLGYVGGSGGATQMTGTDPKDTIAIANALHSAVLAVEDGAYAKATPLLERVTASEPGIQIAQLNLGVARLRQKQYARAIPPLRRAIALQPDVMIAHYELATALYESGDLPNAAAEYAVVARRMPSFADARFSLGSVYARIDRVPDAIVELRAALALAPRHFRANLLLGRILTLQNRAAQALPLLRAATDVDPKSEEAWTFLADGYEKAGNPENAAKARARARALAKP